MGKQRVPSYYAVLIIGSAVGAFGLGTANLWLSGQPGVGRSIEGALFGAIVTINGLQTGGAGIGILMIVGGGVVALGGWLLVRCGVGR